MPSVDSSQGAQGSEAALNESCCSRPNPRPQRLNTWFNLIPVAKFEKSKSPKVIFLDSFVTVESKSATDGTSGNSYSVFFEGQHEMCVVVKYGVIFVWYGEDLLKPDRPFPVIFEKPYTSEYVSSKVSEFENTHIMDFVENGSDNLHFNVVHLWEDSRLYDHVISEDRITLKQDVKVHYGSSTRNRIAKFVSNLLPVLNLHQEFEYFGPGLATVAATGVANLNFHSLVSLTPQGSNGTRLYVTIANDPATFPRWAERLFSFISPKRALCDVLAGIMANFVENEFHADTVIWYNKNSFQDLNLLPVEKHLYEVRRWGESFYPKDFVAPSVEVKPLEARGWEYLEDVKNIEAEKVQRFNVAGEEVIVFKDAQGKVRVYEAYCPHQGAHLGFGAELKDGCVRCPFHGFYFDAEGRCLGPNADNKTKFITGLNLTPIEQRIEGGRIEVFI